MPHGGPYSRDTDRFDYWVQYAAARGYAVLRPASAARPATATSSAMLATINGAGPYNRIWTMADWLIAPGITDLKDAT